MREGFFERDPESGDRPIYHLRWHPENPLSENERGYAQFIRYLITVGQINESLDSDED